MQSSEFMNFIDDGLFSMFSSEVYQVHDNQVTVNHSDKSLW